MGYQLFTAELELKSQPHPFVGGRGWEQGLLAGWPGTLDISSFNPRFFKKERMASWWPFDEPGSAPQLSTFFSRCGSQQPHCAPASVSPAASADRRLTETDCSRHTPGSSLSKPLEESSLRFCAFPTSGSKNAFCQRVYPNLCSLGSRLPERY